MKRVRENENILIANFEGCTGMPLYFQVILSFNTVSHCQMTLVQNGQ